MPGVLYEKNKREYQVMATKICYIHWYLCPRLNNKVDSTTSIPKYFTPAQLVDMPWAVASDPVLIMRLKKANAIHSLDAEQKTAPLHLLMTPKSPLPWYKYKITPLKNPHIHHLYLAIVPWLTQRKIMLFSNHILMNFCCCCCCQGSN